MYQRGWRMIVDGSTLRGMGRTLAVAVVLVLGVAACSSDPPADNPYTYAGPPPTIQPDDGGSSSHEIVYYLTGSASSADLTLSLGPGGQSQQRGVGVPLMNKSGTEGLRFTASDGDFLYISAQNQGGGTLHCRITEDGATVAENTSSGRYSIVTCDGQA